MLKLQGYILEAETKALLIARIVDGRSFSLQGGYGELNSVLLPAAPKRCLVDTKNSSSLLQ